MRRAIFFSIAFHMLFSLTSCYDQSPVVVVEAIKIKNAFDLINKESSDWNSLIKKYGKNYSEQFYPYNTILVFTELCPMTLAGGHDSAFFFNFDCGFGKNVKNKNFNCFSIYFTTDWFLNNDYYQAELKKLNISEDKEKSLYVDPEKIRKTIYSSPVGSRFTGKVIRIKHDDWDDFLIILDLKPLKSHL